MVTLHLKTSSNSHGSWGKSLWPTFVFSTSAHFANFYYSCEDFIHMRISRELSDQKCDRWYSLCGIKIIFKVILKIATLLKKKIKWIYNFELNKKLWPWLVWLSGLSASLWTERSLVRFPVRAHAWVAGQVREATNWCISCTLMFLSLSFSLPSPLSKNK